MTHIDDDALDGTALRGVMQRSMAGVRTDPQQLERRATREGRRRLARRRAGTAVGAAALSVVAVFGVSQLGPGTAGDRGVEVAGGPGASDSPATDGRQAPDDWWNVPADQMLGRLAPLLPAGAEAEQVTTGTGSLSATLTGPSGRGDLQLILSQPAPAPDEVPEPYVTTDEDGDRHYLIFGPGPDLEQQISCPGDLGPSAECTEVTDADGRHVGRTAVTSMGRVVVHEAVVVGPGDGVVYVAVANSIDQRWSAESMIDGPEPPLSVAQLLDLAGDPAWTS